MGCVVCGVYRGCRLTEMVELERTWKVPWTCVCVHDLPIRLDRKSDQRTCQSYQVARSLMQLDDVCVVVVVVVLSPREEEEEGGEEEEDR